MNNQEIGKHICKINKYTSIVFGEHLKYTVRPEPVEGRTCLMKDRFRRVER